MKKVILISVVLFLGLAPHVFAQGFVPLAPIPGLTQGITANSAGLATFFNNLYKYLIGIAAVLAVIQITWGGIEIATNQENVSKIMDSKGKIYNAIFGLVLVLSPALVFAIINPSILNLSLNLPPLDTKSATSPVTVGSGNANGTGSVPQNGCNTPTGTYVKSVTCGSDSAAQAFVAECNAGGNNGILQASACETSAIVNGQKTCTQTAAPAYCEQKLPGTFMTIDLGKTGLFAAYQLQAVGDNAASFTSFASGCKQDGGSMCGSIPTLSVACPSNLNVTLQPDQAAKCYAVGSVYCGGGGLHPIPGVVTYACDSNGQTLSP